jgi:hypothetical protein
MCRWSDPKIVDDERIHHDRWPVRAAAEDLHRNESYHLHNDISDQVCVYCALRASRAIDALARAGVTS